MSVSTKLFILKRGFESFIDFFKNIFLDISDFFKKIFYHPRTEQATRKMKRAREKIVYNLKQNKENLKKRNFDDHGFIIEEEDT